MLCHLIVLSFTMHSFICSFFIVIYNFGYPKLVILKIMASEEEVLNLSFYREVLRSLSLSNTETSVEQNFCHTCTHHDSLMCQQVAAEDALKMA